VRLLVTAGPTEEYIDEVRFLSNPSSGKMGYAVAEAGARRGHRVTLISGPVALEPPEGVTLVEVTSAEDMHRAVLQRFERSEAVVMTAAVSDYRPAKRQAAKMRKTGRPMTLRLVPTPDILEELGRRKRNQVLVGFALETEDELENAAAKLRAKNLDMIVANGPASFRSDTIKPTVITCDGGIVQLRPMKKQALAEALVRRVEERVEARAAARPV
jgi:phosphopantothenoylcysteine decarboxylase/phosphopantothenate--cysteine ligase